MWMAYISGYYLGQTPSSHLMDEMDSSVRPRHAPHATTILAARFRGRRPAGELQARRRRAGSHPDRDQPSGSPAGGRSRRGAVPEADPQGGADTRGPRAVRPASRLVRHGSGNGSESAPPPCPSCCNSLRHRRLHGPPAGATRRQLPRLQPRLGSAAARLRRAGGPTRRRGGCGDPLRAGQLSRPHRAATAARALRAGVQRASAAAQPGRSA